MIGFMHWHRWTVCIHIYAFKPGFHMLRKIANDRGFYFLPTIPDFADLSDIRQRSVPDFRETIRLFVIGRLASSNLGDWKWAKSIGEGRRRSRRYKFEFSFVENDRRPSQKSGTRRENRNAPDSPDKYPFIPDDRGNLGFGVFISRQSLGRSGNSKIPDRLGFSWHTKTRLYPLTTYLNFLNLLGSIHNTWFGSC